MKNFILLAAGILFVTMMSSKTPLARQGSATDHRDTIQQELVTNLKPDPLKTTGEWTPFMSQEMNVIWKRLGLQGVNYYSIGKREKENAYFERSDFKSKYYQAWFGTYVIDAHKDLFGFPNNEINTYKPAVTEKMLLIGVADQDAWLYAMTDPDALTSTAIIDPGKQVSSPDSLTIEGRRVPVFEWSMSSHSDLTDNVQGLVSQIGMPDKGYWQDELKANHPVVLKGIYIYWYNEKNNTLKIIYGCGSAYTTLKGKQVDNYPGIKSEMMTMARSLTYRAIK